MSFSAPETFVLYILALSEVVCFIFLFRAVRFVVVGFNTLRFQEKRHAHNDKTLRMYSANTTNEHTLI